MREEGRKDREGKRALGKELAGAHLSSETRQLGTARGARGAPDGVLFPELELFPDPSSTIWMETAGAPGLLEFTSPVSVAALLFLSPAMWASPFYREKN